MIRVYLLVFCWCVLPSAAWAVEAPEVAVRGIQQAIDSQDPDLLEKYLDVRGTIARGVDVFLTDLVERPPSAKAAPLLQILTGGLGTESGQKIATPMKDLLVEETRKFVVWGVGSGNFAGKPRAGSPRSDGGILSMLFADASIAHKELGEVRCSAPKDDLSVATTSLFDHGSERRYPLQLTLQRQEAGHWRVTEIRNIRELIALVRQEAEAR